MPRSSTGRVAEESPSYCVVTPRALGNHSIRANNCRGLLRSPLTHLLFTSTLGAGFCPISPVSQTKQAQRHWAAAQKRKWQGGSTLGPLWNSGLLCDLREQVSGAEGKSVLVGGAA